MGSPKNIYHRTRTKRWSLAVFISFMNMSSINAMVLYKKHVTIATWWDVIFWKFSLQIWEIASDSLFSKPVPSNGLELQDSHSNYVEYQHDTFPQTSPSRGKSKLYPRNKDINCSKGYFNCKESVCEVQKNVKFKACNDSV
jgi:hypothetical protein